MITLMLSKASSVKRNSNEIEKLRERPKQMMDTPKPVTAISKFRQGLPMGENRAIASIVKTAPSDEVARITPKPCDPTFRMSFANTGKSATAPPKNTENRSRLIAHIIILLLNTKSIPSDRLFQILSFGTYTGG